MSTDTIDRHYTEHVNALLERGDERAARDLAGEYGYETGAPAPAAARRASRWLRRVDDYTSVAFNPAHSVHLSRKGD